MCHDMVTRQNWLSHTDHAYTSIMDVTFQTSYVSVKTVNIQHTSMMQTTSKAAHWLYDSNAGPQITKWTYSVVLDQQLSADIHFWTQSAKIVNHQHLLSFKNPTRTWWKKLSRSKNSLMTSLWHHSQIYWTVEKQTKRHICLQRAWNFSDFLFCNVPYVTSAAATTKEANIMVKKDKYRCRISVTRPFGVTSTDFPQNLSFGSIAPWNV